MRTTGSIVALLMFMAATLAGCAGLSDPRTPAHSLPLWVDNARDQPVDAHVRVLDGGTRLEVYTARHGLAPQESARVAAPDLPPGAYVLKISAGGLERERVVQFHGDANFYRFVVHHDAIGFQEA